MVKSLHVSPQRNVLRPQAEISKAKPKQSGPKAKSEPSAITAGRPGVESNDSSFKAGGDVKAADLQPLQAANAQSATPQRKMDASPLGIRLSSVTRKSEPALRPLEFTKEEISAYQATNQKLAKANPSLAFVLEDPDAFVADMKSRFAEQKELTPATPYDFDISDVARPAFKDMKVQLEAEISKVEGLLEKKEGESSWIPDWLTGSKGKIAELTVGLDYLHELKAEVQDHLGAEKIPYRRTQELGFFTARALGLFDMKDIGLKDRGLLKVDRYLQGYQDLVPSKEAQSYRNNDFSVFQKRSPVGGFAEAHQSFEDAFFNPDKMEMVCVPTSESLGPGPFMRLVSYDIFLTGMTQEPASADGFVRPGGDFWLHDMRHSSAIFSMRKDYNSEHQLSAPQQAKMEKQIDVWKGKLDEARKQVPDKQLRYAIGFSMFNLHHDRGYPMVPSTYSKKEAFNHVPKLLYGMLKISGQHVGFDKPLATMNEAQAWLEDFWSQHAGEEQAIINAK